MIAKYAKLKEVATNLPYNKFSLFEYDAMGGKAYCLSGPDPLEQEHLFTTFDKGFRDYLNEVSPCVILELINDLNLFI